MSVFIRDAGLSKPVQLLLMTNIMRCRMAMDRYASFSRFEQACLIFLRQMSPLIRAAKQGGFIPKGILPPSVPEIYCIHCKDESDLYDADGTRRSNTTFLRKTFLERSVSYAVEVPHTTVKNQNTEVLETPFRFLDLPPEVRNRIYEYACFRPTRPVCVRDHMLRPGDGNPSPREALRFCSADRACDVCRLHARLGTGGGGLSRVNQQIHMEISYAPYVLNTFSVHNLYYLWRS